MQFRTLGKTGFRISEVSLGTWQVGGKWGSGFDHDLAARILRKAIDAGINFIDTADVYEAGESEIAVGKAVRESGERIYVATKCGRQINPHVNEGYTPAILRGYVEDSLRRTGLECLDLIQLHCPPTEVYYRPEIFAEFDKLKKEGKILHLGVSVEKVEEALKAIEYPNVTTVQIIFNMFRQRPAELFFEQAKKRNIGILARVPLASGLLTGKFNAQTQFAAGDHRHFNRNGEMFDKGETFSGLDYDLGLEVVEKLRAAFPHIPLPVLALKWILMFEEVSCVIPGVSKPEQLDSNLVASEQTALRPDEMDGIRAIYEEHVKDEVHHLW